MDEIPLAKREFDDAISRYNEEYFNRSTLLQIPVSRENFELMKKQGVIDEKGYLKYD